jgi:predicted dehydrogenase
MADKIHWGLLSTAHINDALIGPIRTAARSELVAVASRSRERAEAYAREKGIPTAHDSYEALLADPNVHVVYISLPNTMHADWTVKAAAAGKHVLCEKPLVTTMAELERVEAAARENGVTICEAFMYLHHPQTRQALEMVQSGRIGNLRLIQSWFHFYLPPQNVSNIRLNPELAGGSMWDVGVYPNSLSIVMAQAGPPVEVWANQTMGTTGVDVVMRAQMRFRNDVVSQISSGLCTPFREAAHIVGDKGEIFIPSPWKPGMKGQDSQLIITDISGLQETITVPAVDPYLCEVQAMEACILDGAEPIVPLSLSRQFLASILAIYQSARTGDLVQV